MLAGPQHVQANLGLSGEEVTTLVLEAITWSGDMDRAGGRVAAGLK